MLVKLPVSFLLIFLDKSFPVGIVLYTRMNFLILVHRSLCIIYPWQRICDDGLGCKIIDVILVAQDVKSLVSPRSEGSQIHLILVVQ